MATAKLALGLGDVPEGKMMKEDSGTERTRDSEMLLVTDYIESEIDTSLWFCPYDPWVVKHWRACAHRDQARGIDPRSGC